jgi:hypothetical protein
MTHVFMLKYACLVQDHIVREVVNFKLKNLVANTYIILTDLVIWIKKEMLLFVLILLLER